MIKNVLLFSFLFLFLTIMPSWGFDMNPGKYEITAKVEMKGMPGGMAPQTTTQCITKQNPVPIGSANARSAHRLYSPLR